MCGRFALISSPETLAEFFRLEELPDIFLHYNIAPSQSIPIIRQTRVGFGPLGLDPLLVQGVQKPA